MSNPSHDDSKSGNAQLLFGFFGDQTDIARTVMGAVLGVALILFFVVLCLATGLRLMPAWSGPGM